MLQAMPVQNCMHFLMPISLDDWKSYDVPGVVGILRKGESGQYELVDAFDCDQIPGANELTLHEKYGQWLNAAGSQELMRFDVFLMPQANKTRRNDVIALIERSCGIILPSRSAYVNAA